METKQEEHIRIYKKAVNRVKGNKNPLLLFGRSASGKSKIIEYADGTEIMNFYSAGSLTDKEIIHEVISLIVSYAHYGKTIVITFTNYDLALRVKKLTGLDFISLGEEMPASEIRKLDFLKQEQ